MKRFVGLAAISASQIVVTFLAQWAVIKVIGASAETDALFAAMTVPQILVSVLVVSITPVLIANLAPRSREGAARVVGLLTWTTGLFFLVVAAALLVSSFLWLRLLFPVLYSSRGDLMVVLCGLSLIGMVFQSMAMIVWSHHHSRGAHLLADGSRLVATTIALGLLVVLTLRWGVAGAAAGMSSGPFFHLILMLKGVRFTPPDEEDRAWLRTLRGELWPPVAGALYYRFDVLVDRVLTGLSGAGALSVYYLGHQMGSACSQVISTSIANPALPVISRGVAARDVAAIGREIRHRTLWIVLTTVAVYLVFLLTGRQALSMLFGGGSLSERDVETLYAIFICLAGLSMGGALGQMTAGSFYAMEQSRTPTLIGVMLYTVYVPLKVWAFTSGGLIGLALSVSGFYAASVLVQAIVLVRRIRHLDTTETSATVGGRG